MESTASISKGVFLFANKLKKQVKKKSSNSLFVKFFKEEPWYSVYKQNWEVVENSISDLNKRTYSVLLDDIVSYIKQFDGHTEDLASEGIIPSATLLTGVNQPDHVSQFMILVNALREDVTPHIAMINSQDASTIKHLIENAVWQLMYGSEILETLSEDEDDGIHITKLKKSQCTMKSLRKWYLGKYVNVSPKKKKYVASNQTLVIIIPDFESFNCNILQDFVLILSSYVSVLPIVLVFGVATSVSALHKSFPYQVSSKLQIKVFHSHSSPVYMNQVLEEIFLTHTSPFHLSGKALELLTDVFLFYDFSVTGLIQSIKYCMMEHYYGDNVKSLCCERDKIEEVVMNLSTEELENVRRLWSFRPYLEAQDHVTQIGLWENDMVFKKAICKELNKLHDYLYSFYACVRLLVEFVKDLPRKLLGKTVREIYTKCATDSIVDSEAFKESMQLLNFQSQIKLVDSIKNALKVVNATLQVVSPVRPFRSSPMKNNINNISLTSALGENFAKNLRVHLLLFLKQLESASTEATVITGTAPDDGNDIENTPGNRYKLKEKLLKATRVDKIQSEFEMVRSRFVSYLEEVFTKGLQPPHTQTFYEILFFTDVSNVKKHIVGSPRGAIHTALSNPVHYLQCSCCHLPSQESVVDTLPDVCLVYKLHRECGKHINLYDWLQAFGAVLRPDDDDEERHQDPKIQLRFTRAVAELQFLGFIKTSKRKTDHVMRLTW